jgi:biopolymer transport protein ExbD
MAFGGFDDGGKTLPMAEINTTPLVDVMLVLLVIFIITAPLFQQAVPIDLPRVDSSKLEDQPKTIQLALDASGMFHLNGVSVDRASVEAHFAAAAASHPELHLRADRATRYEQIADILGAAQRAGIAKIAFVTERPQTSSR